MDNVVSIISTDWHLQQSNMTTVIDLVLQQIDLAKRYNCDNLICLGDVFDSRVSQREEVLNAFNTILDKIMTEGLTLHCIPGNHDKTNYKSNSSFLNPFKYHPALQLYDKPCIKMIGNCYCTFIPFYDTEPWMYEYENVIKSLPTSVGKKQVLFSHIALNGSVNNDGSKVVSSVTPNKLLKTFDKVYLGHYHNVQALTPDVIHVPSIQQNNFGEDPEKGFFLLFDDGDFEFVKSNFKEYYAIKIDADETPKAELMKLISDVPENAYVKVEVLGSESKLKSLSEDLFSERGIILKKRRKDLEDNIRPEKMSFDLSKSNVKDLFKQFCEEKGYDFEKGFIYLRKYVE